MEALRTQIAFVKQQAKPAARKSKQSASAECYKAIGRIDKELAQLQSRKLERYEAYRSGEISREDFIQIKDNLTSQAEELSAKKRTA